MTAKTTVFIEPPVIVDQTQHNRLVSIAEAYADREPNVGNRLLEELGRAEICDHNKMPHNVIRIGSIVTYRDENTKQEHTVSLTWPSDADISKVQISVATPVGAALIGLSEKASIDWKTNKGQLRHLTVLNVKNSAMS